jgi:hypothetical protein
VGGIETDAGDHFWVSDVVTCQSARYYVLCFTDLYVLESEKCSCLHFIACFLSCNVTLRRLSSYGDSRSVRCFACLPCINTSQNCTHCLWNSTVYTSNMFIFGSLNFCHLPDHAVCNFEFSI